MKIHKNIKSIPFYFFVMFLISITLVPVFDFFGLCKNEAVCNSLKNAYADPLAIIVLALLLSSLVLLLSKHNYILWKKITVIWLVLVILVFVLSPTKPSGAFIPLEPVRDEAVLYTSIPYVLISWLIALWGFLKGRK